MTCAADGWCPSSPPSIAATGSRCTRSTCTTGSGCRASRRCSRSSPRASPIPPGVARCAIETVRSRCVYPRPSGFRTGHMDLELQHKRALVTGGSRGIGKAIARALALEGANVAILARGEAALKSAAAEIANETGATVVPVVADTTSDEQVAKAVGEAAQALGGGLDILVNA